jgi:hypothetical protein
MRKRRSALGSSLVFFSACEARDSQPGLVSILCNCSATADRDHELAVVRRPNADTFGADAREHVLGKFHQHGERNAFIELQREDVLTAELSRGVAEHLSLLTTTQGKAFDPVYFGAWFADVIAAAKLPDDCVLHGLRKTAARRLAEAGCTAHEIMAVTGHSTLAMVADYTEAADQKKRASAAILKYEKNAE